MTAYFIGEHEITDPAGFDSYLRQAVPMIERHGGRYLTQPGKHRLLEGHWSPNRVVIVEFPDMKTLEAWYHAPEYQKLIELRRAAARDVMFAVEGR